MTDDIWPSVEEVLLAHQEDDDGFCPNPDCPYAHTGFVGGDHISHLADVIRWLLRPRPLIVLPTFTVKSDGTQVQNLPLNEYQRTNWTGPRRMD